MHSFWGSCQAENTEVVMCCCPFPLATGRRISGLVLSVSPLLLVGLFTERLRLAALRMHDTYHDCFKPSQTSTRAYRSKVLQIL